ncbi:MAG: FAD-dependent oxidoreductase [Chloroflexi bacterium]|nr:FAD-dependent oxidoreductase [Chloroflexota bacterium]
MSKKQFPKLFEPGRIGSMEVKNRLVMPPMATGLALKDGTVTDCQIDYYEERAKGGSGLVIVEITCVDSPVGKGNVRQIAIDDDRFIPGLTRLAEAIKRHGARAAIQLHHAGRQTSARWTGYQPVAPSSIPMPGGEQPRELTLKEIAILVTRFGEAAERAKRAGFDGVEIHGAHCYLICQFLSPLSNQRQDAYGGSIENRARFLLEVIKAIREGVGKDYPVWCRLSAVEIGVEGGITLEDTQVVAKMAEKAGVDAIHVSAHTIAPARRPPMAQPPCAFVPFAEGIKKVVSVPVIAVSRIPPELGEEVIREGKADFVAMGRPLLADPGLPQKVATGRMEDIRPCLYCLTCLDSLNWRKEGVCCTVNPTLGREREYAVKPAESPKRVIVVGGGPGGMEAARAAALRGHKVVLFDEGDELGGQLLLAAKPPFKETIETLRQYLVRQVTESGVELRLRQRFTADLLAELKPDVVVLATGVTPFIPQIPGIQSEKVIPASQVLVGAETGERVVVIGGELVGCETALYLAERGKKVTIMRRGPELATKVHQFIREPLLGRLQYRGVSILTGVEYEEVTDSGVVIRSGVGERKVVEADTVVLAAGAKPSTELLASIEGKVSRVLCLEFYSIHSWAIARENDVPQQEVSK